MASKSKDELGIDVVHTDKKTFDNIDKTSSETGKESIPTHQPHTPTLLPRDGAAGSKESMEMAKKTTTNERGDPGGEDPEIKKRIKMAEKMRTNPSNDAVQGSPEQRLGNHEKAAEKKGSTTLETSNESIPTSLSHTLKHNPRAEASDNKEIIKVSETTRTNERGGNEVNTLSHTLEPENNEKPAKKKENTTPETGKTSIPKHQPHTPILYPRDGAAESKESMEMAKKTTNERGDSDGHMKTNQSDDVVKLSHKWKLENNETPAKKKIKTKFKSGNESTPSAVSHTPILDPGGEDPEIKRRIKKAEKMRTNLSNDAVQGSPKQKLESNEKAAEIKEQRVETVKEFIPKSLSHTPIHHPRVGAAENKESFKMAEKKKTNPSNDAVQGSPKQKLENNKKAAEKKASTTLGTSNESIPTSLFYPDIILFRGRAPDNKSTQMSEKTKTTQDNNAVQARHKQKLENNEKTSEKKEKSLETVKEFIPKHLPHSPILHPRVGAAQRKESMEMAKNKTTNERGDSDGQMRTNQRDDVVKVRQKQKLENNETPAKKKIKTKFKSGNESTPSAVSHTPILDPGGEDPEKKKSIKMAEKMRTNPSNDAVQGSPKQKLENNEKAAEKKRSTTSGTSNESIPTSVFLPHIILHRVRVPDNEKSIQMSEKTKTTQDNNAVQARHTQKLENNETPPEKKEKRSETVKDFIQKLLYHTPIHHPKEGAAENKESIKMAEKKRTNSSNDAVQGSPKQKLVNNEKAAEKKQKRLETLKKFLPKHLPHTPIVQLRDVAAGNKESMEMAKKERTNERSDSDGQTRTNQSHDVVKVRHKRKLENNETPAKKKIKTKFKSGNESTPSAVSHTPILDPGGEDPEKKKRIKMAEKMRTNPSNDAVQGSPKQKLENNEKAAEKKRSTTSGTSNESIPTSVFLPRIILHRVRVPDNEKSIQMSEKTKTTQDNNAVQARHTQKLENNETPPEKKEKRSETVKDFIPKLLYHTPIHHPKEGAAENKESIKMAEKKRTNLSNDAVQGSPKQKLVNNEKAAEKKQKRLETVKEFLPKHLPHTPIVQLRDVAAGNKESMEMAKKERTNERSDSDGQTRTNQSHDVVKVRHKRKLENNETPAKKKIKTKFKSGNESTPSAVSHTPILDPGGEDPEKKKRIKMAEKMRTNPSNDAVQGSPKQKLENNEKAAEKKRSTTSGTSNESIPTSVFLPRIILHRVRVPDNEKSIQMSEKTKTTQDNNAVQARHTQKLENNETPPEKKEKRSETVKDFIPKLLYHTPIHHPKEGAAENKESFKMAEKKRTNSSNDAVQGSPKQKLESNEKAAEKKQKMLETVKEFLPKHLPHTPIVQLRDVAAGNKESMEMTKKRRTNERGDSDGQMRTNQSDDVVKVRHKRKLENNETPAKKKIKTKFNSGNESTPSAVSHTPILDPGGEDPEKKKRIKMAEKMRTNPSNDAVQGSPKQKLENNEKAAEKKRSTTSGTSNESIPTSVFLPRIILHRVRVPDNEKSIQMSEKTKTTQDNNAVQARHTQKLENNETPPEKKEKRSETVKDFIPKLLYHTPIHHPKEGAAENKESIKMAEKKRTNLSNDAVQGSPKQKLVSNEKAAEKKQKRLETVKEFLPKHLPHTPIVQLRDVAAGNKESMEMAKKRRTNERGDSDGQTRTNQSHDVVKVRHKRKLENNETPAKKKIKTKFKSGNESTPSAVSLTQILDPGGEDPENKKRIKMAEKTRTNPSNDAVQGSPKQKLGNNEKAAEIKEKTLETVKEFIPELLSHTPIHHPKEEAAENKDSFKMTEKKKTNLSNDAVQSSPKQKLENNEKAAERKRSITSGTSKESIPTSVFLPDIILHRVRVPDNEKSIQMSEKTKTTQDNNAVQARHTQKLENNEKTSEKKEKRSETVKELIPKFLYHTPIHHPKEGAAENKESFKMAEKKRTNSSNDAVQGSPKQKLESNEKAAEKKQKRLETVKEFLPKHLPHTPIVQLRDVAAGNKESMEMAKKRRTNERGDSDGQTRTNQSHDVVKVRHKRKLENNETPAKKKIKTKFKSGNESTPSAVSLTQILDPGGEDPEKKKRIKMAEKMRTNPSNDAVQGSPKQKLENNEKAAEKKRSTTSGTSNESIPTSVFLPRIILYRVRVPDNEKSIQMSEKTKTTQDNNAVQARHTQKLENNETPPEKKEKRSETVKDFIPKLLYHTPIHHPKEGAAENKESIKMAEKKRTNLSNDAVQGSPKQKLVSNEKAAEKKQKMLETVKEFLPKHLPHTPIVQLRDVAAGNKESMEMAKKRKTTNERGDSDGQTRTNQSHDVVKVRHKRKLENNETPAKKKIKTKFKSGNESTPSAVSLTQILDPGGEDPENKKRLKMAEKARTNPSNDAVQGSPNQKLGNNENAAEIKEKTLETVKEFIPELLSHTPIHHPKEEAAENKDSFKMTEKKKTNLSNDAVQSSPKQKLENNEKAAEKKRSITSGTSNESIPTSVFLPDIILHRVRVPDNEKSIQMSEKTKTTQDNNAVQARHTQKLENNEKTSEKKQKRLETVKEFLPKHLPHTPIVQLRDVAAGNKESMEMAKKRKTTNERGDSDGQTRTNQSHDVVKVRHKRKLENNETPAKKKIKTKFNSGNESTPSAVSLTQILDPGGEDPENKMGEKMRTNPSNDAVQGSPNQKLGNNEKAAEIKEKRLETVKEFIPKLLSHTPILHPKEGAAENKESFKMAEKKKTNLSNDVVQGSPKQKLENNEKAAEKKASTTLGTSNESIPISLFHPDIIQLRARAPDNEKSIQMSEKTKTTQDNNAVQARHKQKLENNETPPKKKEKRLETVKELIPKHLPHTPILHPREGTAENKESFKMAEKKRTNLSNDVDKSTRKWKLENNKTPIEKSEKTSEIVKASYPTPLSHTPIDWPGGEAPENKAQIKRSNQNKDAVKASCKETLEKNEKTAKRTDSNPIQLSPNYLKNLRCIEKRLVYTDEEEINLEFAEVVVSGSTESASCDSGKAGPSTAPHGRALPRISIYFRLAVNQARACYTHRNYAGAMEQLSKALELCNRGTSVENPLEVSADDISSIASFIETKLAMCCLKMKRPSDALIHAHRSISKNPIYFRNHMRQAAAFRHLERYSEAARSAMIADYMYWLTEGTRKRTSKYIRYYWQAMMEEAITAEMSFAVMYTPLETEGKAKNIKKIHHNFAKKNPEYIQYEYTDPQRLHILPQSTKWSLEPPELYLLTLGFKSKSIGKHVEKWTCRRLSWLSDQKALFNTLVDKEAENYWKCVGQKVMSAMDFIRSTKLTDKLCPCSRAIEKLQQASLFGRMQKLEEQAQLLEQVLAETATIPYLQDISEEDIKLLELLMADANDTLGGRIDNQRVWNEIQKVGLLKDCVQEVEENIIKNKARREGREKGQSLQQAQRPRNTAGSTPGTAQGTSASAEGITSQIPPAEAPERTPQSAPRRTPRRAPPSTPRRKLGSTRQSRPQITSGSTPRRSPLRAARSTALIPPTLLSLIQPCSVVLERLREFPPHM